MQLPNNSVVVVADGRKMLFFRNEGDDAFLNLAVERKRVQDNPADGEQKSDASGNRAGPAGAGGGNFEEADYHRLEEDRFAAETAALLKKRALDNDFDSLLVIAPPRTLGELRKHYHKEVERRLAGEIAKDLTGHPVQEIEKIIMAE